MVVGKGLSATAVAETVSIAERATITAITDAKNFLFTVHLKRIFVATFATILFYNKGKHFVNYNGGNQNS